MGLPCLCYLLVWAPNPGPKGWLRRPDLCSTCFAGESGLAQVARSPLSYSVCECTARAVVSTRT